jgi:hypothetical protein
MKRAGEVDTDDLPDTHAADDSRAVIGSEASPDQPSTQAEGADQNADETIVRPLSDTTDAIRPGFCWALALLLCVPAAKAVLADSIDPDFFWHVRVAEQLLAEGIGPVSEPFSFMSNPGPWTPFSWLGELLMKWTYDATGLAGVVGVHALCGIVFFGFIAMASLEATRQLAGARRYVATLIVVGFAMLMSLPFLSFRPVTMALALMSVMHWLLWRDRRTNDRAVWLLVPATLLLTNLHLYVILWIAGLWARAVGRSLDGWCGAINDAGALKRTWRLTVACSIAALGTPMLPGCIRNAIWFRAEDPMVLHALVAEITPFYAGALGMVLLAGVIGIAWLAVKSRRNLGFENLFWLMAAMVFLFQMGRFASVFALIAMPIAAAVLPALPERVLARRPLRLAMMLGALAMAVRIVTSLPTPHTSMDAWLTRNGEADNLRYPTDAARFVEQSVPRLTGRLFNELTWGGYLIWRLGDRYQVFMDGRTLVYPPQFWTDLYVTQGEAKREILRGESADAAILPVSLSRLAEPLRELGWRKVYADDRALVLVPPGSTVTSDVTAAAD